MINIFKCKHCGRYFKCNMTKEKCTSYGNCLCNLCWYRNENLSGKLTSIDECYATRISKEYYYKVMVANSL